MQESIFTEIVRWILTSGLVILATVLLAVAGLIASNFMFERMKKIFKVKITDKENMKRIETISSLGKNVLNSAVFVIATMMILSELGFDLAPILTTVGILGLAVSFGAQSLVKDIISGFFILLENNIRIGDAVSVGGVSGTVEDIKLRTLSIRDGQGDLHIIPNGSVNQICNMSKDFSVAVFNISISYEADYDIAVKAMAAVGAKISKSKGFTGEILEPFQVHGVQELADSGVVIRATVKTTSEAKWRFHREFLKGVKIRFDKDKIEMPYNTIRIVKD